jgi:hypothetical protein
MVAVLTVTHVAVTNENWGSQAFICLFNVIKQRQFSRGINLELAFLNLLCKYTVCSYERLLRKFGRDSLCSESGIPQRIN